MKEIKIRYSKQRELIFNNLKHRYDRNYIYLETHNSKHAECCMNTPWLDPYDFFFRPKAVKCSTSNGNPYRFSWNLIKV